MREFVFENTFANGQNPREKNSLNKKISPSTPLKDI